MIRLVSVWKSFAGTEAPAVRGVSLQIRKGETFVLLGASGCGKTTLLRMVNRLIEPTRGRVEVDGQDVLAQPVLALRRRMGYAAQSVGLFPHMSVLDNAAIPLRLRGQDRRVRQARAEACLTLVGLDPGEFGRRRPAQLSGGQQQRVGIARALAADPEILLMDEPFGALDAITRAQMQEELIRLKGALGKTIVFVTHDLFEALLLADRIGVMNAGALEQIGTGRELMAAPATEFVRELFERARGQVEVFQGAAA
ncbi:MAG: ATP-binding cassette domain-containing protein [Phycisphaerales bacterium]|nr:ATP-binding cassette domain-containing protein [Phycisphaerales bacterium]